MKNEINKNEIENKFNKLVYTDELTINSIEELMIDEIENYKKDLKLHIEELLVKNINEKKLISKKKKNGEKEDTN